MVKQMSKMKRNLILGLIYLSIFIVVVLLIISLKLYTFSGWNIIFVGD